ncbi:MAG: hypothetical protein IRZ13_13365 [Acetobacteraceae bacterium]|nr:hypothetical protein [Acetobacteraceae bacterium]
MTSSLVGSAWWRSDGGPPAVLGLMAALRLPAVAKGEVLPGPPLAAPAAWTLAVTAIAAWAAAGRGGGATKPAAATPETLNSGSGPT